jgi:hypothetical protein
MWAPGSSDVDLVTFDLHSAHQTPEGRQTYPHQPACADQPLGATQLSLEWQQCEAARAGNLGFESARIEDDIAEHLIAAADTQHRNAAEVTDGGTRCRWRGSHMS